MKTLEQPITEFTQVILVGYANQMATSSSSSICEECTFFPLLLPLFDERLALFLHVQLFFVIAQENDRVTSGKNKWKKGFFFRTIITVLFFTYCHLPNKPFFN